MSNNFVFTYTAVVYEYNNNREDIYKLESGLLTARNFTDAMEQLADYYDSNLVRIVDLAPTNNEMIILPASTVYNYARNEYDECFIPCDQWGNKLTEFDNEMATDTKIDWNVQETTTTTEI